MKIIADIDCGVRHCEKCEALGFNWCYIYGKKLRRTGKGVLRCKQCILAEQEYKKLDALKTCKNCRKGPQCKCVEIRDCVSGWGVELDLWEAEQ